MVRYRILTISIVFLLTQFFSLYSYPNETSAASDVFRVTTYEIKTGQFTGTSYTLQLNNDVSSDYFTMVTGPSESTASRAANQDQVRVSGDPFGNYGSTTNADEISLVRGNAAANWIGSLTVIECLVDCDARGFRLREVLETTMPNGTANAQQTVTDTLSSNYTANTVPFSGRFGGGISTADSDANSYSVTMSAKVTKQNSNELRFDRFGGESRVPVAATFVTYVVEWGSEWVVQSANVTGTNTGAGLDATSEYNTATISSVVRNNTWVWGSGFTRDDGLGDGAQGQAITLGDGVSQNANETVVAVGGEAALISPGRDFQVYVMEHSSLAVDYQFRPQGDTGAGSGFQELNISIDAPQNSESYDNASATVQYTEGYRVPLFYNTSSGTGQAYSRTGAWGLRIDASTNLNYWRAYAGQPVTGWVQVADFGNMSFSNVDTRQQSFRWRDDSTDLNTDGGWLAAENTQLSPQDKQTNLRLRMRVANHGTTPEDAARTYELQFGSKQGSSMCSDITVWTGVGDNTNDEFAMFASGYITPDGQLVTSGLLSNGDGFGFVSGQGRDSSDTTSSIGPLATNSYTELEYALRPTDEAVTGFTYCFRLYDATANATLESYTVYPEVTISSTTTSGSGLGEAGTFTSAVDGGWTSVSFLGTYTTPVVVGTTNSHNGESALVFETRNVTSTGADMRVCESEGATSNGCDTHASETVGYMVIDASVAANIDGIEAGTFTASGEADTNSVITSYSESFTQTPYVFANVNTVNSTEFPIEVVISSTSTSTFTAGICDHLQGSNDNCDGAHGNETVGWVAIEPGNEPFQEDFRNGITSVSAAWTPITFSPAFSSTPVLISASQTDTGGQDVEIDEARNVTTSGADIRYCEIDTLDTCDSHNPDDVAWFAIEAGQFAQDIYLDQDGFRFYENNDSTTPTVDLGVENGVINSVDSGDVLRIRMATQAGEYAVSAGSQSFKLQYGVGSDCSAVGSWFDVGGIGSGTIWRGFNNATPSDGAVLPSSLLDGAGNVLETYEEANISASTPNVIPSTSRGEWDWVVQNNGAANFTSYCFRMVTDSDQLIHYSRYPRLTTSTGVANLPPNDPTNLDQQRTSTTQITTGEVINETSILFVADVSDQNTNDILELCVEVQTVGTAFTNSETLCGSTVVYTGSAVAAEVTISSFENAKEYHWQARTRDAAGLYSSWVSYGGNAETDVDFSVDTVAPDIIVFDGITAGVDVEYNDGDLDELSANWQKTDGLSPDEINGLFLWLDGSDVNATGIDPADGSPISTWVDKSASGNDVNGTGAAVFSASEQAVAFSDDVQPFDDTVDRSGGNANSHSIFSVVQGNANVATNHVWYETTTPRVAPAENGMLGGGTTLSNNNIWGSHIADKELLSVNYDSGGTSTAWLNRNIEYQFSETQNFSDSQRIVIGDDTTGGNRLESGEFIQEIIAYNEDILQSDREGLWEYLECKWDLKDCSVVFEYAIGTSPGGVDTIGWTNVGAATTMTATGLSLETSAVYYVSIRATDVAGNQTVASSDGQIVAPTLGLSLSSNQVVFNNINFSNSYTDTQATTVTTDTNARNGYEVRARATGLLQSGSNSMPMFTGGTYALPDAWELGDTGFGFTSNDPLVEGINKFLPATCAGGGTPPCYVPFSTTTPGDVIADNPGPVSGTPLSEAYTITHRVTGSETQDAGTYQTTIIYSATARY